MERVGKEDVILADSMARSLFLDAVRYHMMPDKQAQLHSHRSQPRQPILKVQVSSYYVHHYKFGQYFVGKLQL